MSNLRDKIIAGVLCGTALIGGGVATGVVLQDKYSQQIVVDKEQENYDKGYNDGYSDAGKEFGLLQKENIDFSVLGQVGDIQIAEKMDDGNYLFSFNGEESVYKYFVHNKTFVKIIDEFNVYSLQKVKDGYLFSAYNGWLYHFDPITNTATQLYQPSTSSKIAFDVYIPFNNGVIISAGSNHKHYASTFSKTLFYNEKSHEVNEFWSLVINRTKYLVVGEQLFVQSDRSLYCYDPDSNSMKLLVSEVSSFDFKLLFSLPDHIVLNGYQSKVYVFDCKRRELVTYSTDYYCSYSGSSSDPHYNYFPVNGGFIFFGTSAKPGAYFLDSNTMQFAKLYDYGCVYKFNKVNSGYLITAQKASSDPDKFGLVYYDETSRTMTKVSDKEFDCFVPISRGSLLSFKSNSLDKKGLSYFNFLTKTVTELSSENYNYDYALETEKGFWCRCDGSSYLYFYDFETLTEHKTDKAVSSSYDPILCNFGSYILVATWSYDFYKIDPDTFAVTQIGNYVDLDIDFYNLHFIQLKDGAILSCRGGVLWYDLDDEQVSYMFGKGHEFNYVVKENVVIFTSTDEQICYKFDIPTKTYTLQYDKSYAA